MAIELMGLTDEQVKLFLHRVRSRDLMAFLDAGGYDNCQRLHSFLSPRSKNLLDIKGPQQSTGAEGIKRCEAILEEIVAQENPCLFCCIIEGKTPAEFVYRGKEISVIMDLYPMHPGHMLVLPHRHTDRLRDLPAESFAAVAQTAQRCAEALMTSSLQPDGYNLMIADGSAAGQEIFHPHMHIIPRYHGDGLGMKFPEGYPTERRPEELKREAKELSGLLEEVF